MTQRKIALPQLDQMKLFGADDECEGLPPEEIATITRERKRATDGLPRAARDNPFKIPGPASISMSGGRTSARMLDLILEAHNRELPHDVKVLFFNTGKEREETLCFVHEIEERWRVPIKWLEYDWVRDDLGHRHHTYRLVNFATASRNGEPFEKLISARSYLPNIVARFCTAELKIRTGKRYMIESGYKAWLSVIGIRFDEPHRIKPEIDPAEPWIRYYPLDAGGVGLDDVMEYWRQSRGGCDLEEWLAMDPAARPGWDLALRPDEGNCDLCFLKGKSKLSKLILRNPGSVEWWKRQEVDVSGIAPGDSVARFRKEYTYAELEQYAKGGALFCEAPEIEDCNCTD